MRGASKLEPAQLLALLELVVDVDDGDAAGDLAHADLDDCHASDEGVVGVDDVDVSHGEGGEQRLRVHVVVLAAVLEVGGWVFQEVGAGQLVAVLEVASDGGVPAVVAPRAQEGLVDSTAHEGFVNNPLEFLTHLGHSEHVVEGVVIVLQPETIELLHACDRLMGAGEAVGVGAVDNAERVRVDGAGSRCEAANEPVVPAIESVELLTGIANEVLVIDVSASKGAKPTILLVEALLGLVRVEHGTVGIEDLLEVVVDLRVPEKSLSVVVVEQTEEEDGEGHSHDFRVLEDGRSDGDLVDIPKGVVNCVAGEGDILIVLFGEDVEAALEAHPDDGVAVDGGLEVLHLLDQLRLHFPVPAALAQGLVILDDVGFLEGADASSESLPAWLGLPALA